jgi:hypothetical protein
MYSYKIRDDFYTNDVNYKLQSNAREHVFCQQFYQTYVYSKQFPSVIINISTLCILPQQESVMPVM